MSKKKRYEPEEWNVEYYDPHEIFPYELNAKTHDEKQVKNIANSIKRFGWKQPAVITSDHVVVIGHGRRLAAMELGCKIPCIVIDKEADELTDDDIKELRLADNLTNESPWDLELKELDMSELGFEGFDFDLRLPFSEEGTYTSTAPNAPVLPDGDDPFLPEPFDAEMIERYSQNAENYTMKRRVIITYLPEQEPTLKKMFGVPEQDTFKVLYDFDELCGGRE